MEAPHWAQPDHASSHRVQLLFSTELLFWLPCSLLDTPRGSKFVLLLANRFLFRGVCNGHNMDTDLTVLYSLPSSCLFPLIEESVWSLENTFQYFFFSGIFSLFLRNINISICNEEKKSSPASYYHHSLCPTTSDKNLLYPTIISDFCSCHVSEVGFALSSPGLWGKLQFRYVGKWRSHHKGSKKRRLQVPREAAGKPGNPHSGITTPLIPGRCSWHKQTCCYKPASRWL